MSKFKNYAASMYIEILCIEIYCIKDNGNDREVLFYYCSVNHQYFVLKLDFVFAGLQTVGLGQL